MSAHTQPNGIHTPSGQKLGNLYHEGSVDPAGQGRVPVYDEFSGMRREPRDPNGISSEYDRSYTEYLREFFGEFNPDDYSGKSVLDIGSGAHDKFGVAAREAGIHVVSINPALKDEKHRRYIVDFALGNEDVAQQRMRERQQTAFSWIKQLLHLEVAHEASRPKVAAALAQKLPFRDKTFDAVLSLYGVPHYLHHLDPSVRLVGVDAIRAAYTPEVRAADKLEIRTAFEEIVRVLHTGGKAFLRDRIAKDEYDLTAFSPTDGSETVEVLQDMADQGVLAFEISTEPYAEMHRLIKFTKL